MLVLIGAIAILALLVPVSRAAEWVEVETPYYVTRLHFFNAREGWAIGHGGSEPGKFLMRSSDAGFTWSATETWLTDTWSGATPADGDRDYLLYERGEFRDPMNGVAAADAFESWSDVEVQGNIPGRDNGLYSPVPWYETSDGGNSWTPRQGVITESSYFGGDANIPDQPNRKYLVHASFPSPEVGVMVGHIGWNSPGRNGAASRGYAILSTQDGGATWKQFLFGEYPYRCAEEDIPPRPVGRIEFFSDTHAWIPSALFVCSPPTKYLFRTHDSGRTWEALPFPFRLGDVFVPPVTFLTVSQGWCYYNASARTTDGGVTWEDNDELVGGAMAFMSAMDGW